MAMKKEKNMQLENDNIKMAMYKLLIGNDSGQIALENYNEVMAMEKEKGKKRQLENDNRKNDNAKKVQ